MGDIKFGIDQINSPTPKIWGRISTSIRYFLVGAMGLISATDIVPASKVKVYVLAISGLILLLKAIDMGLGVQSDEVNPNLK